jgi:sodium-type flagellar protein MotY
MNLYKQLLTLCFFLAGNTLSFADFYQASLQEAKWEFKNAKNVCNLKQEIPLYGSADFIQKPGQPLIFSIQEQRRKPLIVKASLHIMPAPWIHEELSWAVYPVSLDNAEVGGYGRLFVSGAAAESMIDALLLGHYPTFIYMRDAAALNLEESRVAISAIKFRETYQEFLKCRATVRTYTAQNQLSSTKKAKQRG